MRKALFTAITMIVAALAVAGFGAGFATRRQPPPVTT